MSIAEHRKRIEDISIFIGQDHPAHFPLFQVLAVKGDLGFEPVRRTLLDSIFRMLALDGAHNVGDASEVWRSACALRLAQVKSVGGVRFTSQEFRCSKCGQ